VKDANDFIGAEKQGLNPGFRWPLPIQPVLGLRQMSFPHDFVVSPMAIVCVLGEG
jgi:hypothetical protein